MPQQVNSYDCVACPRFLHEIVPSGHVARKTVERKNWRTRACFLYVEVYAVYEHFAYINPTSLLSVASFTADQMRP